MLCHIDKNVLPTRIMLTIFLVATKHAVTMGLKCAPLMGPNVKINSGRMTCR